MLSRSPTNSNIPSSPQKHKSGTSQIQHQFENALDILSKNTQQYLNYYKYLTECSRQLKKMNEAISGLSCGKHTHPELKDVRKIFDAIEKSNKDLRSYIKSDEVKNVEKRENKENDFTAKKKQEIKKILAQITNLHNNVLRINKKPSDSTSCFNALEDGFKYHCSFLQYCTELTNCQDKLFGYINEIHEEVLAIQNDLYVLQNEINNISYKNYLKNNSKFDDNPFLQEENQQISPEVIEQIAADFDKISKHVKHGVSAYRQPQFPTLHIYHFSSPFKPLSEASDAEPHINVTFCASTPLLIEPEKLLSATEKPLTSSLTNELETPSSLHDDNDINDNNNDNNKKSEEKEDEPILQEPKAQAVEDFLDAYKSDSSSDDEPFHALNSSFPSVMIPDTTFETQISEPTSPMNSAHAKSVSSGDLGTPTNYHTKITNVLAARPRSSMKFVVMKQYRPEDFGREISVEEKDIVEVLDANMTEYWYCKKGNTEGFLPALILEPFNEISKRMKSVNLKDTPTTSVKFD